MKATSFSRITGNPLIPYLFLIPACVVLATFVLYPALKAIYLSFTNFNMIREAEFVGFANYLNVWRDPFFWAALKNTLLYMVVVVPVLVIAPIFLAALVNKHIPGITFIRAAIYLPVITSLVISGLIWKWVYEEQGILNYVLLASGVTTDPVAFLTDPANALFSVMAVTIWSGMGYYMVIYLAGLQSIPRHLYEVAEVEGVSAWQQMIHITIPLLRPSIAVVTVMSSIAAMKVFEEVYVMTQGGPMDSTKTLVYYLYESAFSEFEMGYASAIGVVLFLLTLVFSLINLRFLREKT
ncbi:MAG: sugar ABC transporter permease [Rhodocyclaceae bacterium]|jgi:putative chitobiose transport system permease protein|nr:sugar ABC transporter permease [Rhodocyclaceae bacterium]MCA3021932.1 sugar ABC transporter permease [Rhodocyclaceae bacterium]MCA3030221.1 sugar ABC transporter permease [Rhodocyclaceae bacterium]MCA3041486.1 sugar ABC transporter permease [Rhodocyclaceae bacterium]MCA3057006.1 sugar ABC transporter permease [Rhodocyclaceae bacterium]